MKHREERSHNELVAKMGFTPSPSGFRVLALKHAVDIAQGWTEPGLLTG